MKPQASAMIPFAYDYLGIPYSDMDCQAFIEALLHDIGVKMDLPGSNAWYRAMDWTGTPEECKAEFGVIPKGAFLFILLQDGGEPEKYKGDGIGNASHIGLYTGERKGAVHSSKSKGCVCESEFYGKTIPNGGWNRVGLLTSRLTYGEDLDQDADQSADQDPDHPSETPMVVVAESGKTVKMRQKPSKQCAMYWLVPVGATVTASGVTGEWTKISYDGKNGYMQTAFLAPASDAGAGAAGTEYVTLRIPRQLAEVLYMLLDDCLGGING